jgi:hypothetical protein
VTKNGAPFANGTGASVSFTPDDNGTFAIAATVTDGAGATGSDSENISVTNVAPVIASVTGPTSQLALGAPASVSVSYVDAGAADTHTATFAWGDGTTSIVACAAGTCTASNAYAAAGIYSVAIVVSDDDAGTATTTFNSVIVFNANGGHVTGGGFANTTAGKANLNVNAKYNNPATPTGNAKFSVTGVDLNSTSYDWLVVSGTTAKLQGTGTFNGAANYGFLLTVTDAATDTYSITIWNKATNTVVYTSGAAQALTGGNLTIHTK